MLGDEWQRNSNWIWQISCFYCHCCVVLLLLLFVVIVKSKFLGIRFHVWLFVIDIAGVICRSGADFRLKQTNYFNIKQQTYVLRCACVSFCILPMQWIKLYSPIVDIWLERKRKMRLIFGFQLNTNLGIYSFEWNYGEQYIVFYAKNK